MIGDRPMVQRVYEAAQSCKAFSKVVVATDSEKVADCVQGFGGAVEMTRSDHETGTDRVAEVAERYPDIGAIARDIVKSGVRGKFRQPSVLPDLRSLFR